MPRTESPALPEQAESTGLAATHALPEQAESTGLAATHALPEQAESTGLATTHALPEQAESPGLATVAGRLRARWTGREVLLLLQTFGAGDRALIDELAALGATVRAVVSAGLPAPDAPPVHQVWCCSPRRLTNPEFDAYLAEPPADFAAWLDELDPARTLAVVGNPYTQIAELAGRPVHGRRRPRWAALEDKTVIDGFWRETGVPAPDCAVLPVAAPEIADHFEALRTELGAILAMDSTRTFLGDAKGLRWVRSAGELNAALASCRGLTDRVRIAPFVRGVPCSVIGLVLERGVAVFDPLEIITLRDSRSRRLLYCGTSTAWRPGTEAVASMRGHTRAAGTALAERFGYRGLFSVDGIWGADGFAATELNPRHASGLGLRAAWPEFPLSMFQRAVQEREPCAAGLDPEAVESALRSMIRRQPSWSVRVPAPDEARPAEDEVELPVGGDPAVTQRIRYAVAPGSARLLEARPALPDGVLGPAAAALARRLGEENLMSFQGEAAEPAPAR